jgi:hypothetical protein
MQELSARGGPQPIGLSPSDRPSTIPEDPSPIPGVNVNIDSLNVDEDTLLNEDEAQSSPVDHDGTSIEDNKYEDVKPDDNGDDSNWIEDYEDQDTDEDQAQPRSEAVYGGVPIILPRSRYAGAANMRTIKDG